MKKRPAEYLDAAVIAYFWYLYLKLRDDSSLINRRKSAKGWENFRKFGLAFVKKHGTERSRSLLCNFLEGKRRRRKGPVHYLIQDR